LQELWKWVFEFLLAHVWIVGGSMFGLTCTLVTAFPVAIVATIQEWLDSGGYVNCSHISDDVEVWERRGKVSVLGSAYAVFRLEEHAVPQVQHCGDYS
jgi:hypothetical protein